MASRGRCDLESRAGRAVGQGRGTGDIGDDGNGERDHIAWRVAFQSHSATNSQAFVAKYPSQSYANSLDTRVRIAVECGQWQQATEETLMTLKQQAATKAGRSRIARARKSLTTCSPMEISEYFSEHPADTVRGQFISFSAVPPTTRSDS